MKKVVVSVFTVSLAALSTLCLTNCGNKQTSEPTAKIIPVKVVTVGFSDLSHGQNYVGTVEESSAVSLAFSAMGTVERVLVSEGERVRKGQLLAALNSGTAQNAHHAAKSTLHQAQDAYNRLKPLHEKGSLTDIKFIEAETGLEQAKSMEAIARKSVEDCNLYAPMNGVISKRSIEEGVNVTPGLSAFTLVSIDEVDVKISIPENEISEIRIGQPATMLVSALGNREYSGTVHKKGVAGNPVTRTYDTRIRLKNTQLELMPGMVCKVYIEQPDKTESIVIPNRTVQISHDNRQFVWLANGDVAKRQFITIGALNNIGVIVENGLSDGDKLIVEGYQKVSEGMKINILN